MVKTKIFKISELKLDPKNARKHSKRNLEAIKFSLKKFGQLKNIVVIPDGTVIAGNGTLQAAKAIGLEELTALVFEGTAEEARAFAIADNRTAELAEWDLEALIKSLKDLPQADELGFSTAELDKILAEAKQTLAEAIGGLDESGAPEFEQITFILQAKQVVEIRRAIGLAKKKTKAKENKNSNGNALAFICSHFMKSWKTSKR